jgi:glutathione S-transferase
VLLALYEKNIQFKERIINLIAGEQNESWFLKINRNGEIPVLELNGEYISESDLIVDVIDHTFPSGTSRYALLFFDNIQIDIYK